MASTATAPERATQSPLAHFRAYLENGQLAYQYDTGARNAVFYPRLTAPRTGTTELEWRVSTGLGTVYAVTTVAPRGEPPYNVVLVDMDEGFRLMSRVEGIDANAVRIGMRVRFRAHRPDDGAPPYPVFDLESAP